MERSLSIRLGYRCGEPVELLCVAFAIGYFIPGLIEFHAGDYTVYFAALRILKRSDERPLPA